MCKRKEKKKSLICSEYRLTILAVFQLFDDAGKYLEFYSRRH